MQIEREKTITSTVSTVKVRYTKQHRVRPHSHRHVDFAVKAEDASYNLPVSEINPSELAKKLGAEASQIEITISVNMVKTDGEVD